MKQLIALQASFTLFTIIRLSECHVRGMAVAREKSLLVWGMIVGGLYWAASDKEENLPANQPSPIYAKRVDPPKSLARDTKEIKTAPTSQVAPKPPVSKQGYIKGNRVALRGGPGTNYPVLDRFDVGRRVLIFEEGAKWSRVLDLLSQREGWVANFLLTSNKPSSVQTRAQPQTQKTNTSPSQPSDREIAKSIIAASIRSYPGSCPCPFNTDRGGRRCGGRSAYSRPGGYAPICYVRDVTPKMIAAYRAQN